MGPGVKGRPQACITCRRRKKGCDLERPSCGQCRKACIPCGGYTRSPVGPATSSGSTTTTGGPNAARSASSSSSGSASRSIPAAVAPAPPAGFDYPPISATSAPPLQPLQSPPVTISQNVSYTSPLSSSPLDQSPGYGAGSHFPEYYLPPQPSIPVTLPLHSRSSPQIYDTYPSPPDGQSLESLEAYESPVIPDFSNSSYSSLVPQRENYGKYQSFSHVYHSDHQRQHRMQKLRQRLLQQQQQLHVGADLTNSGSLARSAEDMRLIGHFFEVFLPNSKPLPENALAITFNGTTASMKNLAYDSHGIRNGLLALGMTAAGKSSNSPWMLESAFRVYGDALQQLAKTIKPQQPWCPEQLVSIRLLSLYEALFGKELQSHAVQGRSWQLHSSGEAAMFTSNPPSAYIRGRNHFLFIAGRHHMALSALVAQRKTFLCEPDWKTIPWLENEKNVRDHLIDVIVDIPSVVEGIETIKTWPEGERKESYRKVLVQAACDISNRLFAWNDRFGSPMLPRTLEEDLPETLGPEDLATNHLMTLYFSISMRVESVHRVLHRPGEPLDDRIDVDECCRNLVRGVRLFVHPGAGMFRQAIAPFPVGTALQHLNAAGKDKLIAERKSLEKDLAHPNFGMVRDFILSMLPMQVTSLIETVKKEEDEVV